MEDAEEVICGLLKLMVYLVVEGVVINVTAQKAPQHSRANHKPAASLEGWMASFNMSIKKEKGSLKPKVNSNLKEITAWHSALLESARNPSTVAH